MEKHKEAYTRLVSLSEFVENPDNPSVATDEDINRLVGKLKRVPLGLTAMRVAYVTDAIKGKRMVISGNKRLRVLRRLYGDAGEVPSEWFADVTAMSEAERHEFIVAANVSDGEWDVDKLLAQYDKGELGELMGIEELSRVLEQAEEADEPLGSGSSDSTDMDAASVVDLMLDERMMSAKYVFFAFSGGRDSTRAIYLTAKRFLESGKRCEAVYVESPCEYPDLVCHIRRVCEEVGLPLHCIHPDKNYLTEYAGKGKCPDSIFKDCVETLVNKPLDDYIESIVGGDDYIEVRGGQAKQKTTRSHTAETQVCKTKPNMIIYNPLFSATKEQLSVPIPEWPGYAAGFKRTACWCCPFQKAEQYDALRANYPLLFEEMRRIMGSIRIKRHEGDGTIKYYQYWERYGVKLNWC